MKNKTIIRIYLFSSILVLLAGCTLGGPQFPTGDYLDSEGYLTTYHTRGRMWVKSLNADEVQTTHGSYIVKGDLITFEANALCPESDGLYRWSLEGDKLIFELIEDECVSRREALSREIIRYKYTD